ncbi:proteasome activator pa28, REG alpha/beta subunit [Fistulina hepatica ATCC 64428]|uniref:Proteasome activator pa28, REG alpha/beta subunit n=1 Tax=Fistulina hepatica ATCC 64428 TaxID=1128425 RepID=A0A0D7AKB3_9AGAR|nr:proteasome activator pa28, REG alpha/beta subunit [Fistulina hepatica ATCC 64428]
MDAKVEAKIKVTSTGEDIVFRVFPTKELLFSTSSPNSPFHPSSLKKTDCRIHPSQSDDGLVHLGKKRHGRVLSQPNSKVCHDILKRECDEFSVLVDKVKLWVTLTMPNGDNFGKCTVLGELDRAHQSAFNIRDTARQDYLARAKICSKILKYPNIDDYHLSLEEHDERQQYLAREQLTDLRGLYAVITDLIQKNISKIRKPKANNSVGLY